MESKFIEIKCSVFFVPKFITVGNCIVLTTRWKCSKRKPSLKVSRFCLKMFFCSLLLVLILLLESQVNGKLTTSNRGKFQVSDNGCQLLKVQHNFDVSRFLGRWNEIYAYPNTISSGARCVTSVYTFTEDEKIVIYSRFVDSRGLLNRMIGMAEEDGKGVLFVTFSAMRKPVIYISLKTTFIVLLFSSSSECALLRFEDGLR